MRKIRTGESLRYHAEGRPGKIEVVPTKPTRTQRDLSLAYTPGVAEACRAIVEDPDDAYLYTARGNLVAVVTNGTAVLGLGNIGPAAGKPVMEGKAVLFKAFADIDVFDLELDAEDPEDVIRFCRMLEPTVGGINLEDIAAPGCFEIEERLRHDLDIPVFHDDQHGTAIISGAALINALEITGKDIGGVRVVFAGAGAASVATADHYVRLGVDPDNILMTDRSGVIYRGRGELEMHKARYARDTEARSLADALRRADVFVGLSAGGTVKGDMVAAMADRPIVFAMANPDPEITPEEVYAVRDDAIVATGRSDYPNQVNNVLGFPFIFRGALDVRARAINDEMKLAATHALAELARQDVPEAVSAAYGEGRLRFGEEYLIPKPFDSRILLWVAPAVAEAAMRTGVARRELDLAEYRTSLEARLGPARELMRAIMDKARRSPKRIVFPEGEDPRVVRCTSVIREEGIGTPILLGSRERIEAVAQVEEVDLEGVEIIEPASSERRSEYAESFWKSRQRRGVTRSDAEWLMGRPIYYGSMMVHSGAADTLIAGVNMYYPDALRPALQAIGTAPGQARVAGLYLMVFQDRLYFFADTTVNIAPTSEDLAEIAIATADFARRLGVSPRVAMLSFSNFGSVRHSDAERVRDAVELVRGTRPDILIDGEMQADTAVVAEILRETYSFSQLQDPANVLVFPNLAAANICYKLLHRLGGAEAIGPVLLGMDRPVHILQRGSTVVDIANLAAISVVDAQAREPVSEESIPVAAATP
ncbi:MAG: NADP-dependent malic enzyme [Candidatus Palauibacterales bacterium]|nr:NADP-dependent malic enzyme [Candidatus Palauibacterales bacterium]MDP2530955.1 NADP-dependent malic enzyme [Candidatus Palauibacterales bacterium]MDP2583398.1 NADP-dependent malic enzyme [Candidatus Palauibacterales bacterium]